MNPSSFGPETIFQCDTMKEVGPHNLQFQGKPIPGKRYELELTSGKTILVWRSADGQQYFCHGLTFGGKGAPGGAISPYTGHAVETILQEYYQMIPESQARAGDILVWKGLAPETTPHSAVLTDAILTPGTSYLDGTAMLQTKNGLAPETNMSLEKLIGIYDESYNAYRRR